MTDDTLDELNYHAAHMIIEALKIAQTTHNSAPFETLRQPTKHLEGGSTFTMNINGAITHVTVYTDAP